LHCKSCGRTYVMKDNQLSELVKGWIKCNLEI
jgi:hypothetical protein